ncbi:ribonuclease H-like protein [Leucogyrophana mollusca]|uniref:Ribonuclease H-like protein n=1 Tax=Leucogyrophana mollusca TaxID=85980 RepID=A0ACB8BHJ4_9AGAM|nr:ribonuclease H-like protein [Leucogyrophana mollusca]
MKGAEVHESALPVYSFMDYGNMEPAVVYTQSEDEANDAVQTLKGPLGFDLEWRVMWHAGAKERRTALVQLCDKKTILLVQVSHMKRFPQKLLEAIESPSIVKTGANIMNDGEKLFRDFGIRARNLVELGSLARQADDKFTTVYNRNIVSLAKMVSMYLGKTLAKGKERTANWEGELSSAMVHYAANDAHSALMVYHRLLDLASDAGKSLRESMFSAEVTPRVIATAPSAPALAPSSSSSSAFSSSTLASSVFLEPPRPQHLRAYNLWYHRKMPLEMMCMTLKNKARVEPLKESTVISYVIGALQADPSLPFNMDKLKDLVRMEASSWQRHRQWIQEAENRRPTV